MTNTNKNQKYVEVLVVSTVPVVWEEVVIRGNMATQKRNSADADYIAFLLTRRGDARSVITHFAKVKSTDNNASMKQYLKKYPRIKEFSIKNKKEWEKALYHKEYYLDELKELPKPIYCRKGEGRRCQVKLYTTLAELEKAKYFGDIETISQLEG